MRVQHVWAKTGTSPVAFHNTTRDVALCPAPAACRARRRPRSNPSNAFISNGPCPTLAPPHSPHPARPLPLATRRPRGAGHHHPQPQERRVASSVPSAPGPTRASRASEGRHWKPGRDSTAAAAPREPWSRPPLVPRSPAGGTSCGVGALGFGPQASSCCVEDAITTRTVHNDRYVRLGLVHEVPMMTLCRLRSPSVLQAGS